MLLLTLQRQVFFLRVRGFVVYIDVLSLFVAHIGIRNGETRGVERPFLSCGLRIGEAPGLHPVWGILYARIQRELQRRQSYWMYAVSVSYLTQFQCYQSMLPVTAPVIGNFKKCAIMHQNVPC